MGAQNQLLEDFKIRCKLCFGEAEVLAIDFPGGQEKQTTYKRTQRLQRKSHMDSQRRKVSDGSICQSRPEYNVLVMIFMQGIAISFRPAAADVLRMGQNQTVHRLIIGELTAHAEAFDFIP